MLFKNETSPCSPNASAVFMPSAVSEHKKAVLVFTLLALALIFSLQSMFVVQQAYAEPDNVVGDLVTSGGLAGLLFPDNPIQDTISSLVTSGLGGLAAENPISSLQDGLRAIVNLELTACHSCLASLASTDLLRYQFEDLLPEVYPLLDGIQKAVINPLATIVLLIFFAVAMFSIFRTVGETEAGIDIWKIVLAYLMLAFGMILIQYTTQILIFIYGLGLFGIEGVLDVASSSGTLSFEPVPDSVENWGLLMFMLLIGFICMLASIAVMFITYATILIRSIQLYVYTVIAPIPLAFFVSDSSRSVATNFLKKYCALVLTGFILALLFVFMAAVIGNTSVTTVPDTTENCLMWLMEIFFIEITPLAFAYCIAKSGAWAQEIMGAA